jgi:hypothetical protein
MMEALRSFETSVLTRATQRNNPEDSILYLLRRFCGVQLVAVAVLSLLMTFISLRQSREISIFVLALQQKSVSLQYCGIKWWQHKQDFWG